MIATTKRKPPAPDYAARQRARQSRRQDDFGHWFATHDANYRLLLDTERFGRVEELIWATPGSSTFAIRYLVHGPALLVYGDLGSAVYRWSSHVSVDWIARCSLTYFAGKCEASETGREFRDWDSAEASARFIEELRDRKRDQRDAGRRMPNDTDELVRDALRAIEDGETEWTAWMREHAYQVFGDDWYEFVPSFGKSIALRCEAHLEGLKRAVAQLAAKRA